MKYLMLWNERYKIIQNHFLSSTKIPSSVITLLEQINNHVQSYYVLAYNNYSKKLVILSAIHLVLTTIFDEKLIVDNEEVMEFLSALDSEIVPVILSLKIRETLEKIKTAINLNKIEKARNLLTSKFVNENKIKITQRLLVSYCKNGKNATNSILAIQLLKEIKADFNCYSDKKLHMGEIPLIIAIMYNKAIVRELIAAGADVNLDVNSTWRGNINALLVAACEGKERLVNLLLSLDANPRNNNRILTSLVCKAETESNLKIIELLVKAGMPLTEQDPFICAPFKAAVLNGKLKVVDLLLLLGASLYPDIIEDAIVSNNVELLSYLIRKFNLKLPAIIPHFNDIECWWFSGISLKMFQICFLMGMSIENYSLVDKVVMQTPEAVKYFLDRQEKLDITLSFRFPGICENFDSINTSYSLAHAAARFATQESLALMIEQGLDLHVRDGEGATPLHYAVAFANAEAAKILILAGADVNAVDKYGKSPLHWTVSDDENISCAKILLYAGANASLESKNNKKPLDDLWLYADGNAWEEAFKTTPAAEPLSVKDQYPKDVPSLFQLVTFFVANSKDFTRNLDYRKGKKLPHEVSLKIEEVASQLLIPKI